MYAVFTSGGKQYKVSEGSIIKIEKLNIRIGSTIKIKKILMINDETNKKIGTPFLKKSYIHAIIDEHGKSKKINIIKFKRRKHYKKKQGHRQLFTKIRITKIHG
ncbi:50S ribosomal protein L21 [Buchnera aphidicola (Thelaxes californica)]|uniref:Large ribosomal subunit protein bL21 n=1 Tax=Buchnera aphidicola (Thelaxes californica) TaxID=1315998 RepID=A0A4D6YP11_9GAMM|nr:50S ribosomal protein L21 [Buchnera aphidicola]QCI26825.1 50S ribosomal protein L21 [Buchnera aphidicola (Thelaxes californica)]